MQPSNVNRQNLGFTLMEVMTVLVIIGTLAAIGTPSLIAMNNRTKLRNGLTNFSNALQEVQRNAIRTSQSCTFILPTSGTTNPVFNSSCLTAGNLTLNNINTRSNIASISFNYQGNTTTSTATKGTIVFSILDSIKDQKCLVVSPGIGLIRFGDYDPNDTTGSDFNKCLPFYN